MALIRIPFPKDPSEVESLFTRVASILERHGSYQGTPESGSFQGRTPVGAFAGTYRTCTHSGTLEIELAKKPLLVPTSVVEKELRRLLTHVG